jgi:peptidoglycan/LPS O-acetylase OafA/YrhL
MITIHDRLEVVQHRPSGFDYLRILLALGVILAHSFLLTYGQDNQHGNILFMLAPMIVPMFFALSGFLIAGSFERSKSLFVFFGLRILRIGPALVVEVLISAVILGPLLTVYPLARYVADPALHAYFLNILGEIHYVLPGVFVGNPTHSVNGQLWTVPFELGCYIALGAIALVNAYRRKWLLLGLFVLLQSGQILNTIFRFNHSYNGAGGTTIILCFLAGLTLYRFRDRLPYSSRIAALSFVLAIASIAIPNAIRFSPLPMAYLTVYLGLLNPPRNKYLLSGDYSYGLYLYGYPIQQAVVQMLPAWREWYWTLLFSLPTAFAVAFVSWHLIEKPALARKKVLVIMNDGILSLWRHMKKVPVARTAGDF